MTQHAFQFAQDEILPRDTHVTEPAEVKRLVGQNAQVWARLERGPATRSELQKIAPNITARISDLRKRYRREGRSPEVISENTTTGVSIYGIVTFPTCVCHQGSVCGDACWKGRHHDGCGYVQEEQ